jgi:serine/threonine protein kinase
MTYQSKKPNKSFNLKDTLKIITQIIKGLNEIHKNKFIHRDIKL